jgi:hypothetical protein
MQKLSLKALKAFKNLKKEAGIIFKLNSKV